VNALRIVGGAVYSPYGFTERTLTIVDGTIGEAGDLDSTESVPDIDASELFVAPGFIDLQINGGFGIDLMTEPENVWSLGRQLPQNGVTGFLPTIISSPPTATNMMLESLARRPADYLGAEPLGAHFEGPMLSPKRPGAHPIEHLVLPKPELIEGWSRERGLALVTIAPELSGALDVIEQLVEMNVTVSAGHSNASTAEAHAGFDAGITMVTHLFNAMAPLGHRSPNLAGVTLAERHLTAGLIVDGVHVDPVVVAAAWNAKGPSGIALVTDAVSAMGQAPGRYGLADRTITSDGISVRNGDGNLAGSVLTMDRAVRNLVSYSKCEPYEAITSATTTPADLIRETRRGRLAPGSAADIVLLDKNLEVQMTFCSGKLAHVAEEARIRVSTHLTEVT
jgi:N-acetylglucosamine-6-phosphate deacetylase